ncbi:MAG: DNA-binding response regulator [Gammaproteobacteria bacterium]|nr:MAG: DNA-binding response regulator [Gammaproteobacteria bacterium]RKZ43635.1 MAG: DNA-binding response regulator [Gammaproteobacteria bacterium]RKZ77250.1 MAG: DNA-binding response regulator [Gammaproteobacteria bacterium]
MTTAIIADDEAPLRNHLRKQLANLWSTLQICGEAINGPQALELIQSKQPDIAFLDIQMPGMTGLEVVAHCNGACRVVFITAYDQYAVQAFENAAVDYLLKPVTQERLQKTVTRLQQQLGEKQVDFDTLLLQLTKSQQSTVSYLQWLKVGYLNEIQMLPVNEVSYFQAGNKYTSVITPEKEWLIKTSIKELETSLHPNYFWRIHRSTIVRVGAIARVSRSFQGRYSLELYEHKKKELTVSRAYVYRFKQM